jgi:hypothetical protein
MKKKLFYFFTIAFSLAVISVSAQNQVSVDPLTGTVNAAIPVYQISKGNAAVPINLVYGGRGIKPKDVEGSAGIGWYLSAGGQVSRQLRGLPDDCIKDNAQTPNPRLGWIAGTNNNGTGISNFSIANDNNTSTCADETSDINYINSNFTGYSDTEPDIFNVNAPGLSCQLIFDKSKKLQVLSYLDIQAYYIYNGGTGLISAFVITNDKGTQYVFDVGELATQTTVPTPGTAVTYFGNTYNQYKNGVSFYINWYLSSITDVNGNTVSLTYANGPDRSSINPVELFIAGSTTKSTQYTIQQTSAQKILSGISNGTDQLTLNWIANPLSANGTDIALINTITGMGRSFQFDYSHVNFTRPDHSTYTRNFLRGFNDSGCSSPVSYRFAYYGETGDANGNYTTMLSDSSSTFTDYWGYQNTNNSVSLIPAVNVNPSNAAYPRYTNYNYPASVGPDYVYSLGSNGKYVDAGSIIYGSLNTMTNANGGVTSLTYEPNDYLDAPSNSVFQGNGIRVKTITDNDGTGNNMIRNYSYRDPASGQSSGKPVTLPVYAFTIPYTGSATGKLYWDNATVISANDLSSDDHTVMYKYCKESKTGAGSTLYQYYVPATEWDNSATPGCASCTTAEWNPTLTNVARPTCVSYGPIRNDTYTYPFAPAANYSMERGLVQKVTSYNDAGTPVGEVNYTYQRTSPPLIIQALRFDDNNGVKAYAKYNLYATTSELTSQVTKKVYDSPTLSQAQTSTTGYTYSNKYHLLAKQQTTNSDNSVISVNTAYSKDYTIAGAGTDSTANAIYHLQRKYVNIPVETYTQVTRAGVTKTIGAQLTRFQTVAFPGNTYAYLPFQSLKLVAPDGAAFTPFAINSGVATYDSKYIPIGNYTAYDNTGLLQTADDNYKHVQTGIADHSSNQVVALFKNAAVSEIGFEDFDSSLPSGTNFTLPTPTGIVNMHSHNGNAYTFNTGQPISKTISKKTGESFYTLSAWVSSAAAGTINLTLTNSSSASSNYSEPFTNTGNISKYFEWKVPVSNMTATFTVSFTTSQPVYIDDILFYPQSAGAATSAYSPVSHYKISETNTNGVSVYYTNDQWGRLLFAYDQDKNIREKKTYVKYGAVSTGLPTPFIPYSPTPATVDASTGFDAANSACITGVTYTWNFGDGTIITALNGSHQQHTYTSTGNYTVSVTASHPIYGTKSSSRTISVEYPPLAPHLCASGVTSWDNCLHQAISIANCSSGPSDPTHSYYTIYAVGGSGYGTLHYQWQTSADNGVTWTNVGSDANQYSKSCGPKNTQYLTHCIVSSTASGQSSGTSETANFTVQECQ